MTHRPTARREGEGEAHPRPVADAGGAEPVDRILSSLERIGERIRALSALSEEEAGEAPPTRNGVDLRHAIDQIARRRDALGRAAAEEPRPDRRPPPPAEGALEPLRAEIAALRARFDAVEAMPRLEALEASYDDVVARLDQLRDAIDNPRTVADLVQRLAEIRRLIAATPTEAQVTALAERIDRMEDRLLAAGGDGGVLADLAEQVTALAVAVAALDPTEGIALIDARLADVDRQVAGFEARLGALDAIPPLQEAVERQQAVLELLSRRVDPLPRVAREMDRHAAALDHLARQAEALPVLAADLADLRGTLDAEALRAREDAAALAARLDALAAGAIPLAGLSEEFADALVRIGARLDASTDDGRLADLADRIDALAGAAPAGLAEALERIEAHLAADDSGARLAALESRIHDLADALAGIDALAPSNLAAVAERLDDLAAAVSAGPAGLAALEAEVRSLSDAVAALPATHAVERIERRIAEIAGRLERGPEDDGRVGQAIDRLDATLSRALSDEGLVDTAAHAAARAAVAEHEAGLAAALLSDLRAEFAGLKHDLAGGAARDRATLAAIAEAVDRIAAGLSTPAAVTVAAAAAVASAPAPAAAPPRGPAGLDPAAADAWSEIERTLAERLASLPAPGPAVPRAEAVAPAGPHAPPEDDHPLEPGSGRPAPRHRPAAPDPAGEPTGDRTEPSKADFIAAARRAARAAAGPSSPTLSAGERPVPPRAARRRGEPGSRPAGLRRGLFAAAALLAVAAAGAAGILVAGPEIAARLGLPDLSRADLADAGPADAPESVTMVAPAAPRPAGPAPAPGAVDATTTASTPLGPAGRFGPAPQMPPADAFAPRRPAPTETAALAGPAATPTVAAAGGDLPEAIGPLPLRQAAAEGDPRAQYEIAQRYLDGRGVPADLDAAVAWYLRAAEGGLAPAQYRIGTFHEKGQGVARDPAAAMAWYARAAEAGHAKAMHNLAVLAADGAGGQPDYDTAALWFRQAADLGIRDSQFNLGILYAKGLGVPRDLVSAYMWFAVAAEAGDDDAARKRDDVAQVLDADALARARLAVETFAPTAPDASANEVEIADPSWLAVPEKTAAARPVEDIVVKAQVLLAARGFDPGPPDGRVGERTRLAVEAFQKARGLPVTGEIDEDLVRALTERQT